MRRARALLGTTVLACSLATVAAPWPAAATTRPPAKTVVRPVSVPSILRFSGTTIDGAHFAGAALAGRPAVIWLWSPWCGACQWEAPMMRAAFAKYGSRIHFVGIGGGQADIGSLRHFAHSRGVDGFPQLADTDGSLEARFGLIALPTLVFVHADGRVESHPGSVGSQAKLEAMLAGLARG